MKRTPIKNNKIEPIKVTGTLTQILGGNVDEDISSLYCIINYTPIDTTQGKGDTFALLCRFDDKLSLNIHNNYIVWDSISISFMPRIDWINWQPIQINHIYKIN